MSDTHIPMSITPSSSQAGFPLQQRDPRVVPVLCTAWPPGWHSLRAGSMSSISGDKLYLQGAFVGTSQFRGARSRSPSCSRREVKKCSLEEVESEAVLDL